MRTRIALSVAFVGFLTLQGITPALGQNNNGGVPVRIANEPDPKCINAATDEVWLTMYRIIESKKKGFLTSESEAEIIITVKVQAKPQPDHALSFPLSNTVEISAYTPGQVSIPVEYTLVSGLNLKQTGSDGKPVIYTGFSVDSTLVNLKSMNALGNALKALSDVTGSKKLPIPDTPYTQAAGYLLDFATKAVQGGIDSTKAKDKYSTASLALNFSENSSCSGGGPAGQGFETTGTKAILMADGTLGEGYVPIDQTNSYCWAADVTPSFILKAAKKVAGKECNDASYSGLYKQITNDYVAFFLQKQTVETGKLGPNTIQDEDIGDAQKLCDLLHVKQCPAAKKY
jgi:hypothetical protein